MKTQDKTTYQEIVDNLHPYWEGIYFGYMNQLRSASAPWSVESRRILSRVLKEYGRIKKAIKMVKSHA